MAENDHKVGNMFWSWLFTRWIALSIPWISIRRTNCVIRLLNTWGLNFRTVIDEIKSAVTISVLIMLIVIIMM